MAGRRILLPYRNPVIDENGLPVGNARAAFYVKDTNTLATVYSDQALTVPLANPVIANGSGVLPSIWADEDSEFDFAVRRSDGSTIYGLRDLSALRPAVAIGDGLLEATPAGQALVALNGAANKLPYYTGSSTAALTDLTSFARTLLASASASAFQTAANLATFAPRVVATYAALTALTAGTGLLDGGIYQTNTRSATDDGGAGLWRYDAASTATDNGGTILAIGGGGAGRFFRIFDGRNIEAAWFGCVVSLSDQSTAINNAIAACGALGGGYVWLPHAADARIGIGSTLNIGDGSTSQVSTYGNVVLCGRGGEMGQNFDFDGPRGQTTLVWVGSAGGRMVDIKGPVRGVSLRNVLLDGSANASHGLRLNSAQSGEFHNVSFYRIRERHLELDVVQIPDAVLDAVNWAYAARGTTDNVFIGTDFDGRTGMGSTYAPILIYMDGWDAENADPCRNSFIHTKGIVNLAHNAGLGRAGVGIWMRFADSNGFTDTWFQGLGTPSTPTTASWLYMEGCSVAGANYPVNNSFTGKLQRGQNLTITRDATSASPGGNTILPLGEVDQEKVPAWPVTKGIGGLHSEAVDGDEKINFISEYGLQRIRDSWRQQMLNTSFKRATRGTSFSSPAALAQTLDMYRRDKDGTVSDTISRQDFTPGQTDVPFEPAHFMRYAIASASGASKYRHLQRIEDVTRYSGRWVTYSVWLRVSSGTATINASARQNFGSGGSPSTGVSVSAKTEDQSQTVTTDWQRFRFRLDMPSISGKTLGSDVNSSYTEIGLDLPVNTALTLEVAGEQLEYGLADTPWDKMPSQLEEVMIARYLREIADPGTIYGYGPVTGANTARLLVQLEPQMRKAPSLSVSGVAGNYYIRTAAEAGAVACTSLPSLYTSDAQQAVVSFTSTAHGLTANTVAQFYHSGAGGLFLSAEL